MDHKKNFYRWYNYIGLDNILRKELNSIKDDDMEIRERFMKELEFGTGGMRGRMGAGTNMLNIYTVRKATMGIANYINTNCNQTGEMLKSTVIGYDTRHNSRLFAEEAARVLANEGIKAYLFRYEVATPLLSFAVRQLKAEAGIMITASHNPSIYNGYKVYWADGGQITDTMAHHLSREMSFVSDELSINPMSKEKALKQGLIEEFYEDIIEKYMMNFKSIVMNKNVLINSTLKVVYTPLHGTGGSIIPRALKACGFQNLLLVPQQKDANPDCPTVEAPNPEEKGVFSLACELGKKTGAHILMATDLDTDRLGTMVLSDEGEYKLITGNQMGALMLYYLLSQLAERGGIPEDGKVIKTVVTSELGAAIAHDYGVETLNTLTGFKYIGELIEKFHKEGQGTFLFGYEESYGYLIGDFVRDKDAVQAVCFVTEMASYYREKHLSLLDVLDQIFNRYGHYREDLINVSLNTKEASLKDRIMSKYREGHALQYGSKKVLRVANYLSGEITDVINGTVSSTFLPCSNALKLYLEGDNWFCLRPSGTEPKLKIYFGVKEQTPQKAAELMKHLKEEVLKDLE